MIVLLSSAFPGTKFLFSPPRSFWRYLLHDCCCYLQRFQRQHLSFLSLGLFSVARYLYCCCYFSSVSGDNIPLLRMFFNLLPPQKALDKDPSCPAEFHIDDTFQVGAIDIIMNLHTWIFPHWWHVPGRHNRHNCELTLYEYFHISTLMTRFR